jgi:hypothetical protein
VDVIVVFDGDGDGDASTRQRLLGSTPVNRPSLILALLAASVLGFSAWLLLRDQHGLPEDPLAALPADSYGVLDVRVSRVLATPAWQRLVVDRGQARGIQRATTTCGFNPLAGVEQLIVVARPDDHDPAPRFAFTARGRFKHEQLIDCARKLAGHGGLALAHEEIEGIHTVRSAKGSTRIALLGRDGIVGGDGESVRAVIQALVGKRPSLAASSNLHALYRELSEGSDLTAVAQSPERLLPLLGKLGLAIDVHALQLDGVSTLGARVTLQPETIVGAGVVVTQQDAQAQRLAQLATEQRDHVLSIPLIGLTGIAGPLRSAQIEARGRKVKVAGTIKLAVVEAILDLLAL